MLSDLRTISIVEPDASISWLCLPRIDSSSIFAHLLDTENPATQAGIFSISDESNSVPLQSYVRDSMVLESKFKTFSVTDYLDISRGRSRRDAGRSDLIRVIEGTGKVKVVFAPRLNFGRSITRLVVKSEGLVIKGGSDLICLRSNGIQWDITEEAYSHTATAVIDLDKISGKAIFELRCGTANVKQDLTPEEVRREETLNYWQRWAGKLILPELEKEKVMRSALVLKALCYRPSGAISAAGTTSLPESVGGVRNWDYRYCWLRDASMTATSLVRLGSHSEAMGFLDWLDTVVTMRGSAEQLNPLYLVSGAHLGPEGEISELSGYRGSKPVRINNQADSQIQLDVAGPVLDLIYHLAVAGEPLSTKHWEMVRNIVEAVGNRWDDEDHGIWEFRSAPRCYTHTRAMCWVAVDRAIWLAKHFLDEDHEEWIRLRDDIAESINEKCFKPALNAFTSAYDGTDVDSSVLVLGLYGFCKLDDERFLGTIKLIEEQLLENNAVYRYLVEDGLPGREGAFNILTAWLVECYWRSGRKDDAKKLMAELEKNFGATGLMSEQVDPTNGEALGNHPQAYSHLGYINTILAMCES